MTSKYVKTINDTLDQGIVRYFFVLKHFGVTCDLLLNRRTAKCNVFFKNSHIEVAPSYLGNKERTKQTTDEKRKACTIAQRNALKMFNLFVPLDFPQKRRFQYPQEPD